MKLCFRCGLRSYEGSKIFLLFFCITVAASPGLRSPSQHHIRRQQQPRIQLKRERAEKNTSANLQTICRAERIEANLIHFFCTHFRMKSEKPGAANGGKGTGRRRGTKDRSFVSSLRRIGDDGEVAVSWLQGPEAYAHLLQYNFGGIGTGVVERRWVMWTLWTLCDVWRGTLREAAVGIRRRNDFVRIPHTLTAARVSCVLCVCSFTETYLTHTPIYTYELLTEAFKCLPSFKLENLQSSATPIRAMCLEF